ncbi:MAG: Trk system potassium transporter TrkA, partial [Oscillospiraceae bacterium]|nr:Trk system potassium transporter TrkA [Oscillospiraceae bacterium]
AAGDIVRYVRDMQNAQAGEVVSLHRLLDDQVEALEFRITSAVTRLDTPLKQMPIKPEILVAAIIRGGNAFTPTGDDCFSIDDTVVVVAKKNMHISHINMIFRNEG